MIEGKQDKKTKTGDILLSYCTSKTVCATIMDRNDRKGNKGEREKKRDGMQQRRTEDVKKTYLVESHERQLRTRHSKLWYGASKSNFDFSLKDATLGDSFNDEEREFQYFGAMLLIDLSSE